jgi:hypothetical protein
MVRVSAGYRSGLYSDVIMNQIERAIGGASIAGG